MPRNSRRGSDSSSTGAVLGSVLSIAFFIALGIGVVVLKAKRRAARNQDTVQVNDDRGGNGGSNGPGDHQPVNPFQPNPHHQTQAKRLVPGVSQTAPEGGIFASNEYREYRDDGAILIGFDVGLGAVPDTAVVTYLLPPSHLAGGISLIRKSPR